MEKNNSNEQRSWENRDINLQKDGKIKEWIRAPSLNFQSHDKQITALKYTKFKVLASMVPEKTLTQICYVNMQNMNRKKNGEKWKKKEPYNYSFSICMQIVACTVPKKIMT